MNISFEFFPPKSEKMEQKLWSSIKTLADLKPEFISVTYGAGGSTRERTHLTVDRIIKETSLNPAAHLTCVAATKSEVNEVIKSYHNIGVKHIVALRGDPPNGPGQEYKPHPDGYINAADLIKGIKSIADFEISVAAYPEMHPESKSITEDIDMLEAKVEAGASRAITQFFFNNDLYFEYINLVRKRGINIPIVPGIIPIWNYDKICEFAKKCNTSIPKEIVDRFSDLESKPEIQQLVAAVVAAEQVTKLKEQGINDFHFYTLNRSELVYAICKILGISSVGDRSK